MWKTNDAEQPNISCRLMQLKDTVEPLPPHIYFFYLYLFFYHWFTEFLIFLLTELFAPIFFYHFPFLSFSYHPLCVTNWSTMQLLLLVWPCSLLVNLLCPRISFQAQQNNNQVTLHWYYLLWSLPTRSLGDIQRHKYKSSMNPWVITSELLLFIRS